MDLDPAIVVAGLAVGFTVGLTGMGGGALATPLLILVFRVPAVAAVGSDLVASLLMKPFGGAVHWRHRTVRWDMVRWLVVTSVPSAFAGVLLVRSFGAGIEPFVERALGVALVAAAISMVLRARIERRRPPADDGPPELRPLPTLAVGVVGGLVVGMTSVGSGSLVIVLLLLVYPALRAADLVGTDLVQAVPLVASAAAAHLLFGDVRLGVTASLALGGIPGVLAGARLSARAPDRIVRPALCAVLLSSGLRLAAVA